MIIEYGNYKIDIKAKFDITGKETYAKAQTEAVLYELVNALNDSATFMDGQGYHAIAKSRRDKAEQIFLQLKHPEI